MQSFLINYLGRNLLKNDDFMRPFISSINALYNSNNDFVINNSNIKGKVFSIKGHPIAYLIVKRSGMYEIYSDFTIKSFDSYIAALLKSNSDTISVNKIAVIPLSLSGDNNIPIDDTEDNLLEKVKKITRTIHQPGSYNFQEITSSSYCLKMLLSFLNKKGVLPRFTTDLLEYNPELFNKINFQLDNYALILTLFKDVVIKNNFSLASPFIFNDSDNHFYQQEKFIILKCQSIIFCIDFKDNQNYTVYCAVGKDNGPVKKHTSLSSLLEDIKNNCNNYIETVTLHVENGVCLFADNSLFYYFHCIMMNTKKELEEESLGTVNYPIDLDDFDYQLAHSISQYNNNKLGFIMQALFTLGNGYSYNSTKGCFSSEVTYQSNLNAVKKDKSENQSSSDITHLFFFCPNLNITYLNDKWLNALELIVNKIKKDKPDTSSTHFSPGMSFESTINYLENVINKNRSGFYSIH